MSKPELAKQPDKKKKFEDYEIDNAVDTLMRAEEIKANDEMMPHVKKRAGRKIKALSGLQKAVGEGEKPVRSIEDIRSRARKLNKQMDDME